jgi:hypothetical protein
MDQRMDKTTWGMDGWTEEQESGDTQQGRRRENE